METVLVATVDDAGKVANRGSIASQMIDGINSGNQGFYVVNQAGQLIATVSNIDPLLAPIQIQTNNEAWKGFVVEHRLLDAIADQMRRADDTERNLRARDRAVKDLAQRMLSAEISQIKRLFATRLRCEIEVSSRRDYGLRRD